MRALSYQPLCNPTWRVNMIVDDGPAYLPLPPMATHAGLHQPFYEVILAMSDSPLPSDTLRFSDAEIDTLVRTADAISAWMGKPAGTSGRRLETGLSGYCLPSRCYPAKMPDLTVVQVGGPNARIIGSQGGCNLYPVKSTIANICGPSVGRCAGRTLHQSGRNR